MRRTLFAGLALVTAAVAAPALATPGNGNGNPNPNGRGRGHHHAVCADAPAGHAKCLSRVEDRSASDPTPMATTAPAGLDPATITSVYNFPTSPTAGAGTTVAIVDAYHSPTAEADLNTFSQAFGLPSCTKASGCFTQVNQNGGTSYPATNGSWALEIALDVQWVHAVAPGANVLLVEASDNSFTNLLVAEDYASAHAQYVSNSWGSSEFSSESAYDSHFARAGVSFFVSAGDDGLPAGYPSSSPNVISVGGTTLTGIGTASFDETTWSGGGGGCSTYETAPAAQQAFAGYAQAQCGTTRATPDVSLDADPNSGMSVYDTTSYSGQTGWFVLGGTSASAPMWAARSAVAGVVANSAYVYGRDASTFRDITAGSNGATCLVGFDLCAGRGSWVDPAPSFTVAVAPATQSVPTGATAGYTVTVSRSPSFTGDVALSVSGLAGTFSPATIPNGSDTASLTVTAPSTAGTYPFTVTGTSGSLVTSGGATLVATAPAAPDFAVSVSPSTMTIKPGQTATATITITTTGGYASPVTLSLTSVGTRATGTVSPNPVSPTPGTATMTIKTQTNIGNTSRTITINGRDASGRVRRAKFVLVVHK